MAVLCHCQDTLFLEFVRDYLKAKYGNILKDTYLIVRTEAARMYLISNGRIEREYIISYGVGGLSSKENSYGTPPGLHIIKEKIGEGLPPGTLFNATKPTTKIINEYCPLNPLSRIEITSRIFTLEGLEEKVNRGGNLDTYNRKIWIHGTPHTCWLGKPASHGCIRVHQNEITELFKMVNEGTPVFIY